MGHPIVLMSSKLLPLPPTPAAVSWRVWSRIESGSDSSIKLNLEHVGCKASTGTLRPLLLKVSLSEFSNYECRQPRPRHGERHPSLVYIGRDETSSARQWMNRRSDSAVSLLSAVLLLPDRTKPRWHLERLTWRHREQQEGERCVINCPTNCVS